MIMTIFAKYFVEEHVLPPQDMLENGIYTPKQRSLQVIVILGTLMTGIYYITQNGRKFIDDASRYV